MVYLGFKDLKKAYDKVNREAILQVLRVYDLVGKLLVELRVCMLII